MEIDSLIKFLAAATVLIFMPGPDILFVIMESVARGRLRGFVAAGGFASGVLVHTALCAAGVSAVVASSRCGFAALKCAGAAYFLFLAYKSFKAEAAVPNLEGLENSGQSMLRLFSTAFFMDVMNPKVLMFFMGFLPQFVDAGADFSPRNQILVFGAVFMASVFAAFSLTAVFCGSLRGLFLKSGFWRAEKWVRTLFFAVLGAGFLAMA